MKTKQTILTIAVVTISMFLTTCKKDISLPSQDLEKLFGTWEWVNSSGGWAGRTTTPSSEGYSQKIEFNKNGIYKSYRNDKVESKMDFTIKEGKTIYSSGTAYLIEYKNKKLFEKENAITNITQSVRFIGQDTLCLADEAYDGFGSTYVRR